MPIEIREISASQFCELLGIDPARFIGVQANGTKLGILVEGDGGASAAKQPRHVDVEQLGLSRRAYNGLKNARLNSTRDLMNATHHELWRIRHFGKRSLLEVISAMEQRGFRAVYDAHPRGTVRGLSGFQE